MNTAERWGNDDVNEIYALESRALIGLLIHTPPSTQEQRCFCLNSSLFISAKLQCTSCLCNLFFLAIFC